MPESLAASLPTASFSAGMPNSMHAAQAQVGGRAEFLGQQVGRQLKIARHGRDLLADLSARPDEQRQHEVGRREPGSPAPAGGPPVDSGAAAAAWWERPDGRSRVRKTVMRDPPFCAASLLDFGRLPTCSCPKASYSLAGSQATPPVRTCSVLSLIRRLTPPAHRLQPYPAGSTLSAVLQNVAGAADGVGGPGLRAVKFDHRPANLLGPLGISSGGAARPRPDGSTRR